MAKSKSMQFQVLTRTDGGPFDRKKDEDTISSMTDPLETVATAIMQRGDCRIRATFKHPETGERVKRDFSACMRDRESWKMMLKSRDEENERRAKSKDHPKPKQIPEWPWTRMEFFRDWHGYLEFAQEHGLMNGELTEEDLTLALDVAREEYADTTEEEAPSKPRDPRRAPSISRVESETDGKDEN